MDTTREQVLLKQSIWLTTILAGVAIIVGLWVNSQSIAFDGFYALIDAVMTATAFFVSKLIMKKESQRFQFGYWHLEPIVAAVNGIILAITCLYALVNGINALLQGGREVNFELGIIYAIIASVVSFFMFFYIRSANKTMRTEFLRIDSQGWLIGGSLALGLCISFFFAIMASKTRLESVTHYADPVILITVALLLIQIPVRTVWKALREVFVVTPLELDEKVNSIMDSVSEKYGFTTYKSYVAKSGRAHFIEINILLNPDQAINTVVTLDRLRKEIADQLADTYQTNWLTIMFTADKKWL